MENWLKKIIQMPFATNGILEKLSVSTSIDWLWPLGFVLFWKKWACQTNDRKLGFAAFPKEQLKEKYTGGDIVIQACADDEYGGLHGSAICKGEMPSPWRESVGLLLLLWPDVNASQSLWFKDGSQWPWKTSTRSFGATAKTGCRAALHCCPPN